MRSDSPRPSPPSEIRLQKYLASCGVGSRRYCETLIQQGRVAVDGRVVTELGTRVSPDAARVTVGGKPVRAESVQVWMLHKPRGVLCTSRDPRGRPTFLELMPDRSVRLYSVGRLDGASEGLLLVTNNGELANRLTHPRHHVPKTYRVWTSRPLSTADRQALTGGFPVDGVRMRMADVRTVRQQPLCSEVVLKEGRNRQIRRMLGARGVGVMRLVRIAVGRLRLGPLPPGKARLLTAAEIRALDPDSPATQASRVAPGDDQASLDVR